MAAFLEPHGNAEQLRSDFQPEDFLAGNQEIKLGKGVAGIKRLSGCSTT
jgi:hypothetical protein